MKAASTIQENAGDIYAEAQQINEERAAKDEACDFTADETQEENTDNE